MTVDLRAAAIALCVAAGPAAAQDPALAPAHETGPAPVETVEETQPVEAVPPQPVEAEVEEKPWTLDFKFGSYGRAQVSFDLEGNRGKGTNVVAHGPRLFEPSYAELDLAQTFRKEEFDARVLVTLALFDPVAHMSGIFGDQGWAVRNLMVEAGGFVPALPGLGVWAGSRMYRGDDIYLLDFWPLDDLNTIGGGAELSHRGLDLRIHVGVNRIDDDFQFQVVEVPGAVYGADEIVLLERQRLVASARAGYTFEGLAGGLGLKLLLYGEYHHLPGGRHVPEDLIHDNVPDYPLDEVVEPLPADDGFVVGAELGLFGFGEAGHVSLFFRYAGGIAAYGEMGVPFGTRNDQTARGAAEILGAISGHWQSRWVGVLLGGYLSRFNDADVNRYDTDDFAEGTIVARLLVFLTDHFHQGLELSYQKHVPFGIDERTGAWSKPGVFQLTVMEIVSAGRGTWARPQIRLYYTLSVPDADARRLYPSWDARRPSMPEHMFYLGAEWWFNSSTH